MNKYTSQFQGGNLDKKYLFFTQPSVAHILLRKQCSRSCSIVCLIHKCTLYLNMGIISFLVLKIIKFQLRFSTQIA